MIATLEGSGGLARAEGPWPFKRSDSALRAHRHTVHKQKGYKVTFKKVHSVPGAQARQGRAPGQSTRLLTLGAPGNFLFVGGVRVGCRPQALGKAEAGSLKHQARQRTVAPKSGCHWQDHEVCWLGVWAYSSP